MTTRRFFTDEFKQGKGLGNALQAAAGSGAMLQGRSAL